MESHEAGFPPFPHSLEIPSGFPHYQGLDDWIYVFRRPLNSNYRHRKGLVTDVSGPQRNACPGTLTPLSTCVTKQTGDMVYSEARWLWMLCLWAGTTMLYALERESNLGSTFAVFVELLEGRDVGSGPVP